MGLVPDQWATVLICKDKLGLDMANLHPLRRVILTRPMCVTQTRVIAMTILNGNLILATAISLVLAGCGGGSTSEPIPAEGDPLQESASEATQAVEGAATEASNALEQTAESATTAVDSAADAVMDTADSAGWTELQGNWQDSIGSIKDRWADLSEEELLSVNGDREALVTLVQDKYGLDRDTAESEVNDWASTL